jgi:hypothetical protein
MTYFSNFFQNSPFLQLIISVRHNPSRQTGSCIRCQKYPVCYKTRTKVPYRARKEPPPVATWATQIPTPFRPLQQQGIFLFLKTFRPGLGPPSLLFNG